MSVMTVFAKDMYVIVTMFTMGPFIALLGLSAGERLSSMYCTKHSASDVINLNFSVQKSISLYFYIYIYYLSNRLYLIWMEFEISLKLYLSSLKNTELAAVMFKKYEYFIR